MSTMQANGATSEVTAASAGGSVGGGGGGGGNISEADIVANGQSNNTLQTSSGLQQSQSQSQQQQMRSSTSPGSHQQQQALMTANDQAPLGQMNPAVHQQHQQHQHHHSAHYHSQRHAQPYHNHQSQQQSQHYHQQPQQQQHGKYNNNHRGDNESHVNHVLLITVINPHYPITCDLIHQICSTYGKVNRIVIFKKNGIQAMVEFDSIDAAKRAKIGLYGCDIYSGCCTLRIEYAKPTRLNIHKNDNDSYDYTNPNFTSGASSGGPEQAAHGGGSINENQPPPAGGNPHHHQQQHSMHNSSHHHHGHHHPRNSMNGPGRGGTGPGGGGGSGPGSGAGSHNQYHISHHSQPGHHVQQPIPQPSSGAAQHVVSTYGSSVDQSPGNTDAFHQDGGFNVSRTSGGGTGGSGGGNSGPPSTYVGGDNTYMHQHGESPAGPLQGNPYPPRQDGHHQPHHHHHHQHNHSRPSLPSGHNHSAPFSSGNTSNALMSGSAPQGTVMMVYGLHPERLNCDKLFNLFCLYGNVVRVKFLRTKQGCAMVQMGDVLAVDRCVSSLNKITLFDSELQISYSKQAFLHDVLQPFILPDGSPSFKDFVVNKNNRFKNPEMASKNRILPPSSVLHFFNAPFGITEDELVHLFKQNSDHEPLTIKIFTPKADNSKSYSGLATFKDSAEATETLIMCNHLSIPKMGVANPYILRLCFSPPTSMRAQAPQYAD